MGLARDLRPHAKGERMNSQTQALTQGQGQMLSYMSLIQSHLKERPEFALLTSEASVDRLSGQPWGPSSVCDSRWTLRGPNGVLEVVSCVDYTLGGKLRTSVTCTSSELPSGKAERLFGGNTHVGCTLVNVMPVLTEFLQVVTTGRQEPFAEAVMPKAT